MEWEMVKKNPRSIEFRNPLGQICKLDLDAEIVEVPYEEGKISLEFLREVAQKAPTLSEFVYAVHLSKELRESIVNDDRFDQIENLSEAMSTFIATGDNYTFHRPVWNVFNRPSSISCERVPIWRGGECIFSSKYDLDKVCKFGGKSTSIKRVARTDRETQYSKHDVVTGLPIETKKRAIEGEWMRPVYTHCVEANTSDLFTKEVPAAFWCIRNRKKYKENYVLTPKNIRNFKGTHVLIRNCRYLDDFTRKGEEKEVHYVSHDILKQIADTRVELYEEVKNGANWRNSLVELPKSLSPGSKEMFLPDAHRDVLASQRDELVRKIDQLYVDIDAAFNKGDVLDKYWVNERK